MDYAFFCKIKHNSRSEEPKKNKFSFGSLLTNSYRWLRRTYSCSTIKIKNESFSFFSFVLCSLNRTFASECSSVKNSDKALNKEYTFEVVHKDRSHFFVCNDKITQEEWIREIKKVINNLQNAPK